MAKQNRLSKQAMDSLTAACDTLLPSTDPPSLSVEAGILPFYRNSASLAGTPEIVAGLLSGGFKHPRIWMMPYVMWLLSTRIGTLAICGTSSLSGSFPYLHTFPELKHEKREAIMLRWSLSSFHVYRMLFQCLKYITMRVHFAQLDERNQNPSWPALGYCGPDPDFTRKDRVAVEPLHDTLLVLDMDAPMSAISAKLQDKGFKAPTATSGRLTLRCDAVVVGSGSGGSVVAGVLAAKGYKVLVLEKGSYYARSGLSLLEGPSIQTMYEGGGFIASDDLRVLLLAGATVGGGSTINWSASIRTPSHVRKEWADEFGLELFASKTYDAALDAVCRRMGVQSAVETLGFNNEILRKGCVSLGYPSVDVPCNAPPDHYCGWCHLGCKDGKKKSCIETWLSDLADSGNGMILTGCRAIKVLRRDDGSAVGVLVECSRSKEVFVVESDVTVAACGTLNTPGLLKSSGLKNRNIGRHLRLHPCVMAWGYFRGDWPGREKRSYEGGILTTMTTVVEADIDGDGYGAILQTPSLHPSLFATVTPWVSAGDFRGRMRRFARVAHVIALVRDKASSGTVEYPRTVDYRIDEGDETRLGKGLGAALRVLAAAGAEEVGTVHGEGRRFIRVKEDLGFEEFVREESGRGLRTAPVNSAHQMGSCRMAVDPAAGAVRPDGEMWEAEGLFVADGSVFPTAIGVNPMVTIQAIAYCTAQSVLRRLESKNARV